jgi:hypothetical protein
MRRPGSQPGQHRLGFLAALGAFDEAATEDASGG